MTHSFHSDSSVNRADGSVQQPADLNDGIGAAAALAALRLAAPPPADDAPWSAHHLPPPKASGLTRFTLAAAGVCLVALVMAAALSGPIRTTGTKMEPPRFQTAARKAPPDIRLSAATPPASVPHSPPAHR